MLVVCLRGVAAEINPINGILGLGVRVQVETDTKSMTYLACRSACCASKGTGP